MLPNQITFHTSRLLTQRVSATTIRDGLRGIYHALNLPTNYSDPIFAVAEDYIQKHEEFMWQEVWHEKDSVVVFHNSAQQQLLNAGIGIALLRNSKKLDMQLSSADIDVIWDAVEVVLQNTSLSWRTTQCIDGSYAILLWNHIVAGQNSEMMYLQIWKPRDKRKNIGGGNPSESSFATSWTVAGEGTECITDSTSASHSTTTDFGRTILSTHKEDFYIVGGGLNRTEVESTALYAKIALYDTNHSSNSGPKFLGPALQEVSVGQEEHPNVTVTDIHIAINEFRNWEVHQLAGQHHSDNGQWEEALRSYRDAEHICQASEWLRGSLQEYLTAGAIGKMYRMMGRYTDACKCLERVTLGTPQSSARVNCSGELAMVYRHMGLLSESKRAAEDQYNGAKQLGLKKFACRAIGNVGMVNYQMYLESPSKDKSLLESAIDQLNERIERARDIKDIVLEAIGHSRLSLCYLEMGKFELAVQVARENYRLTSLQKDATKVGFAGAFLGRALLRAGYIAEALRYFNPTSGCSPIIALCNEISEEHRKYIVEMIGAGADLKFRDDHGYSALECAIYNGDSETARIIEQGLRDQIQREGGNVNAEVARFIYEANLRKGYRNLFQDELRPVLLSGRKFPLQQGLTLHQLRQKYSSALAEDENKRNAFDGLKFVRYADFVRARRLPRSSDGYTQRLSGNISQTNPFIIFFSYRWIAKSAQDVAHFSPDDEDRTQYKRMLQAIEHFLKLHPEINRAQLCIWIVSNEYRNKHQLDAEL